jgi:hypothetical protein
MKNLLLAGVAAALLVGGTAMAADATLVITPEHRTFFKEYVVKQHVAPVRVRETVRVGTALPSGVELMPVPQEVITTAPELQPYQYFDWNGKIVLVDPQTRQVVQIIE